MRQSNRTRRSFKSTAELRRRASQRRASFESLEFRCLLAGLVPSHDIHANGHDALLMMNEPPMLAPASADPVPATVVARHLFYNNSAFDKLSDGQAIAPDKEALLPGETASWRNYTSYSLGINGVMMDVLGLSDPQSIAADDFHFLTGNTSNVSTWTAALSPSSITVRPGAGEQQSDRIELVWPDRFFENTWLQVRLRANRDTGLAADDVFYFGNAVGESGNNPGDANVDIADELGARQHPRAFFNPAPIDFAFDYNRDARVNASDEIIARNRANAAAPQLLLLAAPLPVAAATGLTASDGTYHDRIELNWNAVVGATGYEIWRSTDNNVQDAIRIGRQTRRSSATPTHLSTRIITTGSVPWGREVMGHLVRPM